MKTALVTGGSRGIGKAISLSLGKSFNVVVGYSSSKDSAEEVVEDIVKSGGTATAIQIDVKSSESIEKAFVTIEEEFDGVDVLVNNAGITKDSLLMRMSEADFDSVMSINMKSVFNMTKAVTGPMLKAKAGSIINMSSVVGIKGNAGQTNYAASKAAINGFTKSIALELGSRNIRCNAIAPGFIETEMTEALESDTIRQWRDQIPLKRGGNAEDIANTTLFLASDLSTYITGQVINVCGGMLT